MPVISFLARRLLNAALLLLLVSTLSFVLLEFAPGDFLAEARLNPQIQPATVAAIRDSYGLNQPLPVRYVRWLESALRGDLGISYAYNLPVSTLLLPRARNTLTLTCLSLAGAWLIALPLGLWSASSGARWIGALFALATSSLLTVPDIVLACLLLFAAAQLHLWSSTSIWLPAATLVLLSLPPLLRHIRASARETAAEPWVRAARGLGISGPRLWVKHILPAAANPLVSLFGLSIGMLVSSSLIVETITGYSGLGPLFLEAVSARDFFLVLGPVMLAAVFLVFAGLITDLLLYALDPRIRSVR